MATGKADEAWQALNARQRLYLSAIYNAGQAAARDIRTRSARWDKTPPADEWRMLLYDLKLSKDILERHPRVQHDPGRPPPQGQARPGSRVHARRARAARPGPGRA